MKQLRKWNWKFYRFCIVSQKLDACRNVPGFIFKNTLPYFKNPPCLVIDNKNTRKWFPMKVKPNSKLDDSANIDPMIFFDDIPDRNIYDSTCFHKLLMIYVKASHLSTIHYRALSSLIFVFLLSIFLRGICKAAKNFECYSTRRRTHAAIHSGR